MNIFQRILQRRRTRRHAEFQEWFVVAHQASIWTRTPVRCWQCDTPATSSDAVFCAHCGAPLAEPTYQQPLQEQTTDPLIVSERPFLAFVHQHHTNTGPRTEEHRAVRLVPLGKGEWK